MYDKLLFSVFVKITSNIKITTVTIESDEAGRELGKPKGHYITIDFPEFTPYDGESMDDLSLIVGKVMKRLVDISEEKLVLVVIIVQCFSYLLDIN